MQILRIFLTLLLVTSVANAREIKITHSIEGKSHTTRTDEISDGKVRYTRIQEISIVDVTKPQTIVQPELASEALGKVKEIGEWRDLYNLSQDALKKNIIKGTAVDYFEHNNERYQRTVKWEGQDEFNFSLTINIDKQ
ncbi:MAG: hypothetical protein JNL36_07080 [Candidatus Kapabacteria bacterium]|jgi:hypothetical protein|nr:hypothetical protein [Candidatus Kapabacteria bacterium]